MSFHYENHQQDTSTLNEFTDEEIREQLAYLGFKNISQEKFNQFKNDLEKLITQEVSINSTANYSDIYQNKANISDNIHLSPRRAYSTSPIRNSNANKKVTFPDDSHLLVNDDEGDIDGDSDQSFASIITTSSIINNDNKVIRRKIVRKSAGYKANEVPVQSSSRVTSQEFDLHTFEEEDLNENENEDSEYDDAQDEQLVKLNDCYPPVHYPIKSFIRSQSSLSMGSDSSRTGFYKANPVNKFHEYNKLWNKQKMPGEKKHNDLRWSIREQMLAKDVIVKRQHKAYEPNSYTIPTDKKRQQLRWAVRNALANQF